MELVSVCPLRTSSILWQKGPSAWVLTVVCKGTFALAPGESKLAEDQEAPNETDNHWDDDDARSLYAASDLAPLKVRADVVLVGSAFSPGGVPARSITARMLVSKVDKSIECWADRVLSHDGTMQEGTGFSRMPLVYERAAGGPGTSNPVGVRRDARDGYGRITLPNLQQPGRVPKPGEALEPVGFGPLPPRWPQRLDKLGRHAPTWSATEWSTRPMPGDIDFGHFNVAPPDQQIPVLRENERIVLENLHRDHPRLMTALPGIRPCAFVEGRSGAPFRLPMHADTLWIDSERAIMTLTWRRQLPLDRPDEKGRIVIAMEQPGQTLAWSDVEPSLRASDKMDAPTIAPPAMPVPPAPPPPAPPLAPPPGPRRPPLPAVAEMTSANIPIPVRPPAATLPFSHVESPTSSTMQYAQPRSSDVGRDSALPFVAQGNAAPAPAPAASPWGPPKPPPPRSSDPDSAVYASPPLPPPLPPPPPAGLAPPAPAAMPSPAVPPAPVSPAAAAPSLIDSPWVGAGVGGGMGAVAVGGVVAAPTFGTPPNANALTASNAAAAKDTWSTPRPEPVKVAQLPAAAPAPAAPNDILELLWFDPDSVPRIRRNRAWKPILDALEQRPVDRDLDDPALANEPMEMEDRREVFEILAHGASTDAQGVSRRLDAGVRSDGKFVPQLTLLAADLAFEFDELGTLRATVTTVAPMVTPADEPLKAAVDSAKEFLQTADELTPPSVSESMTTRVREAFAQSKRTVPETHLEEQTSRVLLSQRRYQKRIVFGASHLRCMVRVHDDPPIPAYLPESLEKKLPMFQRFRGRIIAEVHQQADQYETHRAALRVVALARATTRQSDW